MCVVAEGLMKRRTFADASINQVGVTRTAERKQIGFDGNQQFCRRIGKLAEHRLAAEDDKLIRARNAGGGADDVLKLWALHGGGAI